jgi:hypothetical protein
VPQPTATAPAPAADVDLGAPLDARALEAQYAAATAAAERLAAGLSEAQGRWRPRPGAWSVAECLAHVAVLNRTYLDPLDRVIARARADGRRARGPMRLGWFGRRFTRAMGPVTGRGLGSKLPAPAAYAPPSDVSLADALRDFREVQAGMIARVRKADGLDLSRIHMKSPAWPMLRFSLLTGFAALAAHARRHLAQARRVTERPEFPAG